MDIKQEIPVHKEMVTSLAREQRVEPTGKSVMESSPGLWEEEEWTDSGKTRGHLCSFYLLLGMKPVASIYV